MAERRMFSKTVVNSARFLRMAQSSRLLYYDLGMAADDDGFVEAFTVIRTTGAAETDLKALEEKGFIRVLNEDLVSYITDWKRNNLIRSDRYHESIYCELLSNDTLDKPVSDGIPTVYQLETEVRLDKDSIGKVSVDKSSKGEVSVGGAEGEEGAAHPNFTPMPEDEFEKLRDERLQMLESLIN